MGAIYFAPECKGTTRFCIFVEGAWPGSFLCTIYSLIRRLKNNINNGMRTIMG